MLAKASEEHSMDISLPAVVQVWKAGCIIRSAMLQTFEQAFAANETLSNLLLDKSVSALLEQSEDSIRARCRVIRKAQFTGRCLRTVQRHRRKVALVHAV